MKREDRRVSFRQKGKYVQRPETKKSIDTREPERKLVPYTEHIEWC